MKKIVSMFAVVCLIFSLVPTSIFALPSATDPVTELRVGDNIVVSLDPRSRR
jgi:hypothetical protein